MIFFALTQNCGDLTTTGGLHARNSFVTQEFADGICSVFCSNGRIFHTKHRTWKTGHDLIHDLQVSGYALLIAQQEYGEYGDYGKAAWVAGMLHSSDRFIASDRLEAWVRRKVPNVFSPILRNVIVQAVLDHGEPNNKADSFLSIYLKDAGRLANINPTILLRSAQFRRELPTHDPRHLSMTRTPGSTYKTPLSVLDDIFGCTEWESWLRTEAAKRLAAPYFEFLKSVFTLTERAHLEAGINHELLGTEAVADYFATAYPRS